MSRASSIKNAGTTSTSQSPSHSQPAQIRGRAFIITLFTLATLLTTTYVAASIYITTRLTIVKPQAVEGTPADFDLDYRDITIPARGDHIAVPGWLVPGIMPDGSLTVERTIIMVHGTDGARTERSVGIINLSAELARRGFAIVMLDLRGHGNAPVAPNTYGYFEHRDVLGAVDFLRSGPEPYPELGRPRFIGGWGVSMGGVTLIMAAAQEPAIQAIVSDCAFADLSAMIYRDFPAQSGGLPTFFVPGALIAAQTLYGADLPAVSPIELVPQIAPRPIFFIHGDQDTRVPFSHLQQLADSARTAPGAQVQTWAVPDTTHAQSFLNQGQTYVDRVATFFTDALQ